MDLDFRPITPGVYDMAIVGVNSQSVVFQIVDGPEKGREVFVSRARLGFKVTVVCSTMCNLTWNTATVEEIVK